MSNNETNNGTNTLAKEFEGIKKPAEYQIRTTWNGCICTPENTDWTLKDLNGLLAHVDDGLHVQISKFANKEEAAAFANNFPKFVKVRFCSVSGGDPSTYFIVDFYVNWTSKATGVHNEAGMKRAKKFVEVMKSIKV
jgi:hypothetical protein